MNDGDTICNSLHTPSQKLGHCGPLCHIELPAFALTALDVLESSGFEAWCVGGFVRDALLGLVGNDVDVATNAHWLQVKEAFERAGFKTRETGVKHGTITAIVDDNPIEITTFRTDGRYLDNRRPSSIHYVSSIEDDLARRDFTVNAIAYNPQAGFVDCFGGMNDLKDGIIRSVGKPRQRFDEDALRILRACRFSSQLGFEVEEETLSAAKTSKCLLRHISTERIAHEIETLLMGEHVHDALLNTVDVISYVVPELVAMKGFDQRTPYHIYDVLEHTAWVVQHSPVNRVSRWAALFHDMGKPGAAFDEGEVRHFYGHAFISVEIARGIMGRFLIGPAVRDKVLALVKYHDDVVEPTPKAVKRMLTRLDGDAELFRLLCMLKRADALSQAPHCHERAQVACELEKTLDEVLAADEAFSLKQLAVNGRDVLDLGCEPGPEVGRILQALLDAVVDEAVANEREALLEFARWEQKRTTS